MCTAYARVPDGDGGLLWWYVAWYVPIGICQGAFGLFTMYLPPLFPTLLRTTGAGFCYNIGRIAAAVGTVYFGTFSQFGDHRLALLYASFLFLPAAAVALMLMEPPDEKPTTRRDSGYNLARMSCECTLVPEAVADLDQKGERDENSSS